MSPRDIYDDLDPDTRCSVCGVSSYSESLGYLNGKPVCGPCKDELQGKVPPRAAVPAKKRKRGRK